MPIDAVKPREVKCSFCGKADREVKFLVMGLLDAAICNECVVVALEIMFEAAFEKDGEPGKTTVHQVVRWSTAP